jgi:hypothetical protein
MLVPVLSTVTFTPGITEPLVSRTSPLIDPVISCAPKDCSAKSAQTP